MARIEGMTFAQRLRTLAASGQYGHVRKPHNYYPSDYSMSDCPWDWMHREVGRKPLYDTAGRLAGESIQSVPTAFDYKVWQRFTEFARRYRAFHHYMKEIKPGWRVVTTHYYADNSEEVEEVDTNGNRRQRMTLAPSGDLCF